MAVGLAAHIAPAALSLQLAAAGADSGPALQLRVKNPMTAQAVLEAGRAAADRLAEPGCASVFSAFSDGSGRTLQSRLDELGRSAPEHLAAVYFYDGANRSGCQRSRTHAVTMPGSVVIHVCPSFVLSQRRNPRDAPIIVIHELLHTLGLGENPPSSLEITRQVSARCGK
jgi:hypothetical protein